MPGDVLVRANQDELAAVEAVGRLQPQRRQRHAAQLRGGLDDMCALRRPGIEEGRDLLELSVFVLGVFSYMMG